MDVRPIETEADYDWAVTEMALYFDNEPMIGSPEAARASVLATLIGAYEDRHWQIAAAGPVDTIKEVMALSDRTTVQLAALLGSHLHASELLSGRRGLTIEQAWKLHSAWGIPAEALIQPAAAAE